MTRKYSIVLLTIFITAFFYLIACNESSPKKSATENPISAERIERGRYLAETVGSCMHCHSDRDFSKFAGPIHEETKGMGGVSYPRFGTLYSSNITPDSATGIGSWTDDEIARAIAFGIGKDGDTLFPIMPYFEYNKMSKEDIYSIVAYLRTLKPISNKIPPRKLKTFASVERDLFHFTGPEGHQTPAATDEIKTGQYLAAIGACRACHTPRTEDEHFDTTAYFSGGDQMGRKFGFIVNSPNITPDSATGIGAWPEEMFVQKFTHYRDTASYGQNPGKYNTLMPWEMLAKMKEDDIRSIYKYLRSLQPISHKVEKWPEEGH